MVDRPSIGAALFRVLVAAACLVAGYEHVSHQDDALHQLVIDQALPLPASAVRPLGILELACGVTLLVGLTPRLAALCLLVVAAVSAGHTLDLAEDRLHLIGPATLAFVCLLLLAV